MFKARFLGLICLAIFFASICPIFPQASSHLLLDYDSETGDFTYLNNSLGTDIFYAAGYLGKNTIVANVEAGLIWYDHDAFNRPPDATSTFFAFDNPEILNDEIDYHATMVGHVLAGSGYVADSDPAQFYYVGIGMAPYASIWSASVATEFSGTNLGAFEITDASTIAAYEAFFNGISGERPDVINSSWGGSDPAGTETTTIAIDGLARQNSAVAFVVSAGNSGTATVGGPGSGYNNITVGSVGGANLLAPSDFSSRGLADFYNPDTLETLTGVRVAVDLAAPGENLVLAAYLGDSGSLGASTDPEIAGIVQEPSPGDLYFTSVDGTSFSAPIVSGGIALLKDVAKSPTYAAEMGTESLDTRVIKSVLMASARETIGWNNGQTVNGSGVTVTTQALDLATGAGALDLENAATTYVGGTTDVAGSLGGNILASGWDFGAVGLGLSNDYLFDNPFADEVELTASLNWFVGRSFDNETDVGANLSFADLNLQVWQYIDGMPSQLIAESITTYNNTEYLRITLTTPGLYGLSVVFEQMIYDLSPESVTSETYGLAWQAKTVPEPSTLLLVICFGFALVIRSSRQRSDSHPSRQ
jgi:hypothetical protein